MRSLRLSRRGRQLFAICAALLVFGVG